MGQVMVQTRNFRKMAVVAAVTLVAGCGLDSLGAGAGTAGSAAAAAKQGQEQKARADAQIKAMQQASQKHVDGLADEVDRATR